MTTNSGFIEVPDPRQQRVKDMLDQQARVAAEQAKSDMERLTESQKLQETLRDIKKDVVPELPNFDPTQPFCQAQCGGLVDDNSWFVTSIANQPDWRRPYRWHISCWLKAQGYTTLPGPLPDYMPFVMVDDNKTGDGDLVDGIAT